MAITLNHTIVHAYDKRATATFLAEILGLASPTEFGPFIVVQVGETSLDFVDSDETISPRHFAFLVSEEEFDTIFSRIQQKEIAYWADPFHQKPNEVYRWNGGRGIYFEDPNRHNLEILTKPYTK